MTKINRYLINSLTTFSMEENFGAQVGWQTAIYSMFFKYGAGYENRVPSQIKVEILGESFSDFVINFNYDTTFSSHIRTDVRNGVRILSPAEGNDNGQDIYVAPATNHIYKRNIKANRWMHLFGLLDPQHPELNGIYINGVPLVRIPAVDLPVWTPETDLKVRISLTLADTNVALHLSNVWIGIKEFGIQINRTFIENFIDLDTGAPKDLGSGDVANTFPLVYLKGDSNDPYFNTITGNALTPSVAITSEVYEDDITTFTLGGGVIGRCFQNITAIKNGGGASLNLDVANPIKYSKLFLFAANSFYIPTQGPVVEGQPDLDERNEFSVDGAGLNTFASQKYSETNDDFSYNLSTLMIYIDGSTAYRWINGKPTVFENLGVADPITNLFKSEFFTNTSMNFVVYGDVQIDSNPEIPWTDPAKMYALFYDTEFLGLKPFGKYGEILGFLPLISVDQSRGLGWLSYTNGASAGQSDAIFGSAENFGTGVSMEYDYDFATHTRRKYV